jgi:hypothetical protein
MMWLVKVALQRPTVAAKYLFTPLGNAYIAIERARESYRAAAEARTLQEQTLEVEDQNSKLE